MQFQELIEVTAPPGGGSGNEETCEVFNLFSKLQSSLHDKTNLSANIITMMM